MLSAGSWNSTLPTPPVLASGQLQRVRYLSSRHATGPSPRVHSMAAGASWTCATAKSVWLCLLPTTSRAIRPAGSNACFTAGYTALYSRSLRPRGHISATFKCRRWVRSIMPRARSNSHGAREQRLVTVLYTLSFLAQVVRSAGTSIFVLGDASLSDERAALQAKRLSSPL